MEKIKKILISNFKDRDNYRLICQDNIQQFNERTSYEFLGLLYYYNRKDSFR